MLEIATEREREGERENYDDNYAALCKPDWHGGTAKHSVALERFGSESLECRMPYYDTVKRCIM